MEDLRIVWVKHWRDEFLAAKKEKKMQQERFTINCVSSAHKPIWIRLVKNYEMLLAAVMIPYSFCEGKIVAPLSLIHI